MKVYKDLISGDEMFMDTYPMELLNDAVYRVEGAHVSRNKVGDIVLEGANASAEEPDESGADDTDVESGVDIVLNMRLVETGFPDKKAWLVYLKDYMKRLAGKLEENGCKEIDTFKTGANAFIKEKMGKYKDMQFFLGESMDNDAMVAMMLYEDKPDGNEAPFLYFFKHGLEEEKL